MVIGKTTGRVVMVAAQGTTAVNKGPVAGLQAVSLASAVLSQPREGVVVDAAAGVVKIRDGCVGGRAAAAAAAAALAATVTIVIVHGCRRHRGRRRC